MPITSGLNELITLLPTTACRYEKGPWSECDKATNKRTRSLTLKKGDSSCEQTKTKTKPCKNNKGKSRFYTYLHVFTSSAKRNMPHK